MKRCREAGCPTQCGTRRKPSCADRMVYYVVLAALLGAFLVSTVSGIRSAWSQVQMPAPATEETHGSPPWLYEVVEEHVEFLEP